MSLTNLQHSVAHIIRRFLIEASYGSSPSLSNTWPIAVGMEHNTPDNFITVYDTAGDTEGARHIDGGVSERYGIQIRVRSNVYETGMAKIKAIVKSLDMDAGGALVVIGATTYKIHCATRSSTVVHFGREIPANKCDVFTVNVLVKVDVV